jgi:transitional endoplasmic reticulum ATPase
VLAAQAHCSFYPVTAADLTSKWLGESERNVKRLFQRARENQPSVIFIDEVDAIASDRGEAWSFRPQINQLLAEIDGIKGQRGVFVLAATNRPERLDPALLRGGRLSPRIEIPLPDRAARLAILERLSAAMPLESVDLDAVAGATGELSGADLKALCQQAALLAMVRASEHAATSARAQAEAAPAVTSEDFEAAVAAIRSGPTQRSGQYL